MTSATPGQPMSAGPANTDALAAIERSRARVMRNTIIAMLVVLLMFTVKALHDGIPLRVGVLSFAFVAVGLAYYYNRRDSRQVALTLVCVAYISAATSANLTAGTFESAVMGWYLILVCLVGLLGGRRQCAIWTAIAAVIVALLWLSNLLGLGLEQLSIEEDKVLQARLNFVAQMLVASTLVISFVDMNEKYERELTAQMGRLWGEVALRACAEQQALASDRAKTQFLTNMSHEIRTPLNSIIGFSSRLIKKHTFADPKDADAMECIWRNGKGLLYLVNELLELASVESQPLEYSPLPVSIDRLVEECVVGIEPVARSYGLRLVYKGLDAVEMHADHNRLHQVVSNLIYFAIRQTREGGVEVTVSRALAEGRVGVQIAVSDTSPGIPEEQMAGLFDTHYQLIVASNRDLPISALTLALTARLVRKHHGDIRVQSQVGSGTRFLVWLPLEPV